LNVAAGARFGAPGATPRCSPCTVLPRGIPFLFFYKILLLVISDALQKKGVTNPTELDVQNVRQDTVEVDSRPTNPEPALRPISDDPSSPPIQSAVIRGLPGSSFEPSATGKPASRRLGTESDVRGWHFHRQSSAVAQKPSHLQNNKGKWPKAFAMFLEAHQDFLRKIRRQSETASPPARE